MIASTTPTTPTRLTLNDVLARAYVTAVLRAAYRRPALPLDHSTPPVGLCCIAPPAMTEGA